jgi:hypothetical protein
MYRNKWHAPLKIGKIVKGAEFEWFYVNLYEWIMEKLTTMVVDSMYTHVAKYKFW